MENKSTKNNIKNEKVETKTEEEKKDLQISYEINEISNKRKQEILDFLLSNVIKDDISSRTDIKKINNNIPYLPLVIKFDLSLHDIDNSHCILISNNIIIILTKDIYRGNSETINYLDFPQIKENIPFSDSNIFIENKNYNNIFSVIKILNPNFFFEKYFEIPDDNIDIESSEKFFINNQEKEESLGITFPNEQNNTTKGHFPGSPIYIKKDNILFLIGIVTEEGDLHIFSRDELMCIKKEMENIELKSNLNQIKKLDFSSQTINDDEMHFIFKYDYKNLEYINLEKKNITDKGLKSLENKSLAHVKYLNLSDNPITDLGLTYLDSLSNLDELLLFNMDNLSDDYFSSLKSNSFIYRINNLKCDKKKLILDSLSSNYNNFSLPNLTYLKITCPSIIIQKHLKELFSLDKICQRITELDLSNTGLTDNGMLRLIKNISLFKNIEQINLEGTKLTTYSGKYFEQLEKQKIKIILKINNLEPRMQKTRCRILLGGSTISGKTTYMYTYLDKSFHQPTMTTVGVERINISNPKYENMKFILYDPGRWNGRFDSIIHSYIQKCDGIILLFDISDKNDFYDLPYCLRMITDYYELEDFPVLLIGNKADEEKLVNEEEIEEFFKKEKFIGYFEVSCKNNSKVSESVEFILNYIYEKEKKFPIDNNTKIKNIKLSKKKK